MEQKPSAWPNRRAKPQEARRRGFLAPWTLPTPRPAVSGEPPRPPNGHVIWRAPPDKRTLQRLPRSGWSFIVLAGPSARNRINALLRPFQQAIWGAND